MENFVQLSITIGALGIIIVLIGLFPGIIGMENSEGIGVLQVLVILAGFGLLFIAAYMFVRQIFYPGQRSTLGQDIAIRLTLTGLLFSAAAGLADVLGFGTHPPSGDTVPMLGRWQTLAFVGGIVVASGGVVLYTIFGPPDDDETDTSTPDADTAPDTTEPNAAPDAAETPSGQNSVT